MDDEGRFHPTELMEDAGDAMLDELGRVAAALQPLRDTTTVAG